MLIKGIVGVGAWHREEICDDCLLGTAGVPHWSASGVVRALVSVADPTRTGGGFVSLLLSFLLPIRK